MHLETELRNAGCQHSAEIFREQLISSLPQEFPDRTIDGLVCEPADALAYCDFIRREGIGSESLSDNVILKALMNIRRQKNCPTGLKSHKTKRNLQNDLDHAGYLHSPTTFKDLVCDCMADMYKSQTIDELVCHPREAEQLCHYVRKRSGCRELQSTLILSTLMNVRKSAGRN